MLAIHPDARASFDERARGILAGLSPAPEAGAHVFQGRSWIRPHVAAHITDADILSYGILVQPGPEGEPISITFMAGQRKYTLDGPAYAAVRALAQQLTRTGDLNGVVTETRVHDIIVDWIVGELENTRDQPLTEFVLRAVEGEIANYRVVIPIYNLFVEKPMQIGKVRIAAVSASEIADWYAAWKLENPSGDFDHDISRWTKQMAGKAVASTEVVATRDKAARQGRDEIEAAVGMLRIFSKGAMYPAVAHAAVLGKERVESDIHFMFRDGRFVGSSSGFVQGHGTPWILSSDWIDDIVAGGLQSMGELLSLSAPSKYQASMVDALLLYSRCALESHVEAKLIWIFAALESQLLATDSEPVQDNISHRLAYLLRETVEDRRAVVSVVKGAYGLRSRFFHHGVAVKDLPTVREFMRLAWTFVTGHALSWRKHTSKEEFLRSIDDRRLGG